MISRKKHTLLLFFLFYFICAASLPYSHCHVVGGLAEEGSCGTRHSAEHLLLFAHDPCCDLHEKGHTEADEHHLHFLIDDQGIVIRYNQTGTSLAPQIIAVVSEILFNASLHQSIGVVVSNADFYQEALLSYSSGLSPPLS